MIIEGAGYSSDEKNYSFYDEEIIQGATYWYYLEDVSYSGERTESKWIKIEVNNIFVNDFIISQNYPNPFNPYTKIPITLQQGKNIKVEIFNTNGKLIRNLHNGNLNTGRHEITWNGINNNGSRVSSGIYLCKISSMYSVSFLKMIFIQ